MNRRTYLLSLAAAVSMTLAACVAPVAPAAPAAQPAAPAAEAPKATEAPAAATAPKLLLSMKGPGGGNPFWAAVEKGATDKAKELGVELSVQAPPQETDVAAQVSQVEDAIAKGVTGIIIAPTDPAALKPVLEGAIAKGVKVVFVDTKGAVDGVTFIGTNNENGAALAAKYMCDTVAKGAKVAILQGIITQSTGKARADGSKKGMTDCGLNLVAELPAEWDTAKGQAAMEDILTKNPDIAGVFASNDNMALGAVEALKAANLIGKVVVVGFDANPNAATAVLAGEMNATIAQNPGNMGAFGVENVLKLIKGETIEAVIDTGTTLVTKDNAAQFGGAAPAAAAAPAAMDMKDVEILVSMKGPGGGNPFWAAVEKGALEAGAAAGVKVTVQAPPQETDVAAQVTQVEDAIAKGVKAIVIAPTDPAALKPVLEGAIAKGIKVVFIDTKGAVDEVTFIGTNNEVGAALGAKYLCDNVAKGAKVAILQGIITQSTGKARADGAKKGLTDCGLNVVAELPAEWDTAKGQAVMEDILTKNPDVAGVFASNDNMALGVVEALKAAGVNDKVIVVGFDANPNAAAAVLAGDMEATVAQAPVNMGKFGVESVIKLLKGETIDANIDTGTVLVDKSNAESYK